MVLKSPQADWPVPASLADWLGVAAGFGFAVTNILLRRLRNAPGEARALAMFGGCAVTAGATALAGTASARWRRRRWPTRAGWGWALLLGTGFVFANVCLQYGAARLCGPARPR